MPADGSEHVREPFAQLDCALAALQVCADRNDLGDACGVGAFDDLRQIAGEVRKVEVGVGVVEYGHASMVREARLLHIGSPRLNSAPPGSIPRLNDGVRY